MSGTAALSAARKRRASTVQTPGQMLNGGTPMSYSNTQNPYYNSGQQQQQLPQGYLGRGMPGPGLGGISLIPQNMTIHENIELIKTQMDQRLQLINTKGRTMPPEKLKMLQKQQEIQMQILKQKIAIAQEMEEDEDNEPPHFPTQQQQPAPAPQKQPPPPKVEPPIIYDRGIPRPNPKYVAPNPNDVTPAPAPAPAPVNMSAAAPIQAQKQQPAPQSYKQSQQQQQQQSNRSVMPTATLTPFVSMTSAGGAIPPPIVILKSHDDKIGEHDAVLNDLTNRVNYIHSRIDQVERNGSLQLQQQQQQQDQIKHSQNNNDSAKGHVTFEQKRDADDTAAEAADDDDEPMILMTEVISDLLDSREFMQGVVDKIMNETNLAEVIFKIDPIIKENQELRTLIHSQQETMNQMNTMLLKFLNTQAEIMLSSNRDSNRHDVQTDCSVIDETHEVCNEDGLYEDWQNNVSLQVQYQQEQQPEEQEQGHEQEPEEQQEQEQEQEEQHEHEQQPEEQQQQEQEQQEQQHQQEQQPEGQHEHEQQPQEGEVPEQCQGPEQTQEQLQEQPVQDEQLTTEVVDNEHDTTSDNEAPSFPDMDRLKLLVSEIPESDM
jgi:hypothetical protein